MSDLVPLPSANDRVAKAATGAALAGEIGRTGLKEQGGIIREEWVRALDGPQGVKTYEEMTTDAIVGAVLHGVTMELRKVEWNVSPADGENEKAVEIAEKVEQCMDDMSSSWDDFIAEALSMIPYGWSYFNTVYKVRNGDNPERPGEGSKYDDGWIGWRKHSIRSQDSLFRWELDEDGGIKGMWQKPTLGAKDRKPVLIPIDKALLFRASTWKNNPQGRSALRSAYISWYRRKRIMEYEAVGVERDIVGIPVAWVPQEWLLEGANTAQQQGVDAYRKMVEQIRMDEQAGIVMPLAFDGNGNKLFDLTLLQGPGGKTMPTTEIIKRYSQELAMSCLADIILIGHEAVGSYALSKEKREFFTNGLEGWLKQIASVLNRHAIPRLMRLNNVPQELWPTIEPAPVRNIDLAEFGGWLTSLSGAGYPLFPNDELEEWIANISGMPWRPREERVDDVIPDLPKTPLEEKKDELGLKAQEQHTERPMGVKAQDAAGRQQVKDGKATAFKPGTAGPKGSGAPSQKPAEEDVKRAVKKTDDFLTRVRERVHKFDPTQARDSHGRWTSGGAGLTSLTVANIKGHTAGDPNGSLALYTDENGNITPERERLHDEIVNEFLEGVPSREHPEVFFLGGGPASGKSSVLATNPNIPSVDDRSAVLVNPDEIKSKLPEYDRLVKLGDAGASAWVHEESSLISKKLMKEAALRRQHVLMDTVGNSDVEKLRSKVQVFRDQGYAAKAYYVTVPTDVAVQRAAKRAQRTGRHVPETVMRSSHAAVSKTLPAAVEHDVFDYVALYDNSGSEPKLVMTDTSTTPPNIINAPAWDHFRAKAGPIRKADEPDSIEEIAFITRAAVQGFEYTGPYREFYLQVRREVAEAGGDIAIPVDAPDPTEAPTPAPLTKRSYRRDPNGRFTGGAAIGRAIGEAAARARAMRFRSDAQLDAGQVQDRRKWSGWTPMMVDEFGEQIPNPAEAAMREQYGDPPRLEGYGYKRKLERQADGTYVDERGQRWNSDYTPIPPNVTPRNIDPEMERRLDSGIAKANPYHDSKGRFTTGPKGGGGTIGGRDAAAVVRENPDGFTIVRSTGRVPTKGYAVAVEPERSLVIEGSTVRASSPKIRKWVDTHRERLDEPGTYVGGWYSDEHKKVVLDVVNVTAPTSKGLERAKRLGAENDQISIWSLHEGREIPTGGTGGDIAKAGHPAMVLIDPSLPVEEIVNQLATLVPRS